MKLKEIIRNKWAWWGAVIGILLAYYHIQSGIFFNILGNELYNTLTSGGGMSAGYLIFIYLLISGFIIGLILQKIWRKIK